MFVQTGDFASAFLLAQIGDLAYNMVLHSCWWRARLYIHTHPASGDVTCITIPAYTFNGELACIYIHIQWRVRLHICLYTFDGDVAWIGSPRLKAQDSGPGLQTQEKLGFVRGESDGGEFACSADVATTPGSPVVWRGRHSLGRQWRIRLQWRRRLGR
jgi:hypothetical protein